jgi:hypothetical protein
MPVLIGPALSESCWPLAVRCFISCAPSNLRLQGITTFSLPQSDFFAEEFSFFKAGASIPFFSSANFCWPAPQYFLRTKAFA